MKTPKKTSTCMMLNPQSISIDAYYAKNQVDACDDAMNRSHHPSADFASDRRLFIPAESFEQWLEENRANYPSKTSIARKIAFEKTHSREESNKNWDSYFAENFRKDDPPAPEWIESIEDIDLITLVKRENMRTRASNVCIKNEIFSLKALLRYYYTHKESFFMLRNSGVKTDKELGEICRKYTKG